MFERTRFKCPNKFCGGYPLNRRNSDGTYFCSICTKSPTLDELQAAAIERYIQEIEWLPEKIRYPVLDSVMREILRRK